ncbi:MAG: NADH dehydrogenase [Lachnospiraceae bacterium]|nr:NADH dehydrogenase [Lachnospiraceae bacterium]
MGRAGRILAVGTAAAELLIAAALAVLFYRQSQIMLLHLYETSETVLEYTIPGICGFGLHFRMDGFRLIYALVAALMWAMTTLLSGEYFTHHKHVSRFYLFLLWTLGATMGVFLSADLLTTFIFFEIMSFTSYVWVAQEENAPSLRAAETYLAVAVIGGLVMLMGIFLLFHELGTVEIAGLLSAAESCENKKLLYAAGVCLLVGFGAKAGAFPLHIWLPKAHPVAPAPASALLSGILTKTGIYGILILSCNLFYHDGAWGMLILALGVITMLGGALLAVFSVDLKRTLACSSMSQVGFILVGIGMQGLLGEENALAVHGTLLHMVNHSLIKLVLFMAAGVIYMNVHALDLNVIRGYGRKKPLLKGIFLVGALAIGGIPLFGGYVSKTLLHESIVEYGGGGLFTAIEWIFLFSGGLTVAYMAKLFVAIFVEKNADAARQAAYEEKKPYMNRASGFALTVSAVILLVWGLVPHVTMDRAARLGQGFMGLQEAGEAVAYYSWRNLSGALISIGIGAVVYLAVVRGLLKKAKSVYVNRWPAWLDLEELLYRPLLRLLSLLCGILCRILDSVVDLLVVILRKTLYRDSPLPYELPEGNLLTKTMGHVLNGIQWLGNRTWKRRSPTSREYVHLLAMKHAEIREDGFIIRRSLSFGLLLFCVGLGLTLVYILLL